LLGNIYIIIPIFTNLLLPKFQPGILPAQIFLISTYFDTASPQSSNFLVANNKQSRVLFVVALALLVNVILNYVFIKSGLGIAGAATATAISSFIAFFLLLVLAMWHFEKNVKKILFFIGSIFMPFAYSVSVLLILRLVKMESIYIMAIVQMLLFTLALSPFVVYFEKKTGILKTLLVHLKAKMKKGA